MKHCLGLQFIRKYDMPQVIRSLNYFHSMTKLKLQRMSKERRCVTSWPSDSAFPSSAKLTAYLGSFKPAEKVSGPAHRWKETLLITWGLYDHGPQDRNRMVAKWFNFKP